MNKSQYIEIEQFGKVVFYADSVDLTSSCRKNSTEHTGNIRFGTLGFSQTAHLNNNLFSIKCYIKHKSTGGVCCSKEEADSIITISNVELKVWDPEKDSYTFVAKETRIAPYKYKETEDHEGQIYNPVTREWSWL